MFKFWYCPLLLCTTFLSNELVIGKSNFVAPSPLGKMCTQPIWSFPALFNSTDSKSFSLLNFQNLKRKIIWVLISIAFTKNRKMNGWKLKEYRLFIECIGIKWDEGYPIRTSISPDQNQDNIAVNINEMMLICERHPVWYTYVARKKTPAIWRCTDASGFHWMSNDHVPGLYCKTISFKN